MPRERVRYNARGPKSPGGRTAGLVCEKLNERVRGRPFQVRSWMNERTDKRGFESKVVADEGDDAEPRPLERELRERLRSVRSASERRTIAGLAREIGKLPAPLARAALEVGAGLGVSQLCARASISCAWCRRRRACWTRRSCARGARWGEGSSGRTWRRARRSSLRARRSLSRCRARRGSRSYRSARGNCRSRLRPRLRPTAPRPESRAPFKTPNGSGASSMSRTKSRAAPRVTALTSSTRPR